MTDPSIPPGSSAPLGAGRLAELLRGALPPATDDPHRDVWPEVVERLERRSRWSLVDLGLAAAATLALLMNPEWIWLLAYHL